jgi:chorismate synthase
MRYLTAGESHGQVLTAIIEGIPANLTLTLEFINHELARRQMGYGRGGRMIIEKDQVEILSGVRNGKTIGSPITLQIKNRDWVNWEKVMLTASGAEYLLNLLKEKHPGINPDFYQVGPVLGIHAGPGAVAIVIKRN